MRVAGNWPIVLTSISVQTYNAHMAKRVEVLKAELEAINLWDHLYVDNPAPDAIEKDACFTRTFRRVQVVAELHELARRN